MTEKKFRERLAQRTYTNRLTFCVGAMCVVSTVMLVVTGIYTVLMILYLIDHPPVCDAVFEDFDDLSTVPEIVSIDNGVINPLAGELRHVPGNEFIPILNPITLTFDPNKVPIYVGVTADSVGRNGFVIRPVDCNGASSGSVFTSGGDVDGGSRKYLLVQELEICEIEISQMSTLAGDGIGITQVVMAYACTESGLVANLPVEPLREIRSAELGVIGGVTALLLIIFIVLAVQRKKRLRQEHGLFASSIISTNVLETDGTIKSLTDTQAGSRAAFMIAPFSKAKEAYARRQEMRKLKKEEEAIALANRKADIQAKKEAAKAQRRLLHHQYAEKQRQALAQAPRPQQSRQQRSHYASDDDDIF